MSVNFFQIVGFKSTGFSTSKESISLDILVQQRHRSMEGERVSEGGRAGRKGFDRFTSA